MNLNQKNSGIHSLGKLNLEIYSCITTDFITDEVIITEEQLSHIREKHPEAYQDTLLVIKIITSKDNKDYKNSVITGWKITEKRLNNYIRNKNIIYKKE